VAHTEAGQQFRKCKVNVGGKTCSKSLVGIHNLCDNPSEIAVVVVPWLRWLVAGP